MNKIYTERTIDLDGEQLIVSEDGDGLGLLELRLVEGTSRKLLARISMKKEDASLLIKAISDTIPEL